MYLFTLVCVCMEISSTVCICLRCGTGFDTPVNMKAVLDFDIQKPVRCFEDMKTKLYREFEPSPHLQISMDYGVPKSIGFVPEHDQVFWRYTFQYK